MNFRQMLSALLAVVIMICASAGTLLAKDTETKAKTTAVTKAPSSDAADNTKKANDFIKSYYLNPDQEGDWVVKIEDVVITKKDFEDGYKTFLGQLPEVQRVAIDEKIAKKQYLNNLIMEYVVINQIEKENILANETNSALLRATLRQLLYQLYFNNAIPQNQEKFKPSEDEITQYYNQNKDRLSQMGMTADQMREYCIQALYRQKAQIWMADYLQKTKENYRIKRNDEFLKKEGLD